MKGVAAVLGLAAAALLASTVSASGSPGHASALPRNDRVLVLPLRAGPYRYLDGLKSGRAPDRQGEWRRAVAAFGPPTALRAEWLPEQMYPGAEGNPRTAGYCHATWAAAGITVTFFAWNGWWPYDETERDFPPVEPCAPTDQGGALFLRLRLFGPGWRNRTGLRVGHPVPAGHRRSIRNDVKTPDGHETLYLWPSLDRSGRVTAINVEIMGRP